MEISKGTIINCLLALAIWFKLIGPALEEKKPS
jgi:hypothetical protein